MRAELAVRDALVRTRTRYIALAKALVRRDGLRVPTSSSAWVPTRMAELDLSPTLTSELAPRFAVFAPLTAQIAVADARIAGFVNEEPIAALLTTAPGVGPVTACAFVATIDDLTRFRTAHELEASLCVVPSARRSGEKRQLGRITKAGNGRLRWLLVEAAWTILRSKSAANALRWLRSRVDWPAICLRCGATMWRTTHTVFVRCQRPSLNAGGRHRTTKRESSGLNRERRAREFP
ncbi:transposase [Gemmatimonas sp.]|uniref:transposase n=1 Tax=Gemmatimonas sp. TaxID=1962908 RepID=UPI0035641492